MTDSGNKKIDNAITLAHKNYQQLMEIAPDVINKKYVSMQLLAGKLDTPLLFRNLNGNRFDLMYYYKDKNDGTLKNSMNVNIIIEQETANAITYNKSLSTDQNDDSQKQETLNSILSGWLEDIQEKMYKPSIALANDGTTDKYQKVYFNSEQKPFLIGMGKLGNGLTVWNKLEQINGDYKTIAHIDSDRSVKYYENDLPGKIRETIENEAKTAELTAYVSQQVQEISAHEKSQPDYFFPDSSLSLSDLVQYGYTGEDMLPLTFDRALELFDRDHIVYMLYDDNTEMMVIERDEIIADHAGIFGIERSEWETSREFREVKETSSFLEHENKVLQENRAVDNSNQGGLENMDKKIEVYTKSWKEAWDSGEGELHTKSRELNVACAEAIDKAISASNFEQYRYDLKTAVKSVISEYGAERMNYVLANRLQTHTYDGRYSNANKEWAKSFDIPQDGFKYAIPKTHPAVLDGFITKARKICAELQNAQTEPKTSGRSSTKEKPSILKQLKDDSQTLSARKRDNKSKETER